MANPVGVKSDQFIKYFENYRTIQSIGSFSASLAKVTSDLSKQGYKVRITPFTGAKLSINLADSFGVNLAATTAEFEVELR
jgi:hypothetical protein